MYSKAVLLSVLAAIAEARFGQEQIPIPAIQAVTSGGGPGVAATLAGSAVSTILAATNPCLKLVKADEIIAQLGTGADAVKAAQGLVAAEKNFNPFLVHIPVICSDPTLPKTQILRGIVPLIDPAVVGSDLENKNSAASLVSPFNAVGMSVAQVMAANGFTNFTTSDLNGVTGGSPAGGASQPAAVVASSAVVASTSVAASSPVVVAPAASSISCIGTVTVTVTPKSTPVPATSACGTTMVTVTVPALATAAATAASSAVAAPVSSTAASPPTNGGIQKSTVAGLDFGLCVPTMKFEAGLNGRKVTEFTFQAIDPLVNKGQQEALNPNIITNRICDQLTNVCNANAAAKTACQAAKAKILALGTRTADTANQWNAALGFAGTNINPDNAPQPGLVGHT